MRRGDGLILGKVWVEEIYRCIKGGWGGDT